MKPQQAKPYLSPTHGETPDMVTCLNNMKNWNYKYKPAFALSTRAANW